MNLSGQIYLTINGCRALRARQCGAAAIAYSRWTSAHSASATKRSTRRAPLITGARTVIRVRCASAPH